MTYMTHNGWNLTRDGRTEIYVRHVNEFVARFKYFKPGLKATHFCKFLTANFTPAEYFALRQELTPIGVLETKGYTGPMAKV